MLPSQSNREPAFDSMHIAAEDVALQLGWLRECPYHGQPFKADALPRALLGGRRGHTPAGPCNDELIALAMRVAEGYAEYCPHCALERSIPE